MGGDYSLDKDYDRKQDLRLMFLAENSRDRLDFSWTMKTNIWDRKTSFPDLLSLGDRQLNTVAKGQTHHFLASLG